jgi:phage shock protein A
MKESIRKRVGRIISGVFNSSIDSMEAGADVVVLEETVRETDSAIEDLIDERNARAVDQHNAARRLATIKVKLSELATALATAIEQDMEDHAREVISSQMDLEKQEPVVQDTLDNAKADVEELDEAIEALRAKKREMKAELAEYLKMKAAEEAGSAEPGAVPPTIASTNAARKAEQAQATFDRVVERKTGLPSGLSSGIKSAKALSELQAVSRGNRIDERLAAAKASMSGSEEQQTVPAPATVAV